MKILRITLAMAILLFLLQLQPNVAGRTLHEKLTMVRRRELELKLKLQSLQRVSVPPSGPSGCTFIPGTNGPGCPLKERHYAAKRSTRRPITHRRHSAPVRVVETLIWSSTSSVFDIHLFLLPFRIQKVGLFCPLGSWKLEVS